MNDHRYSLLIHVTEPVGGIRENEIPEHDKVADSIILCAIEYPDSGGTDINLISRNGVTPGAPLSDADWFMVWVAMSQRIATSGSLSQEKLRAATAILETFGPKG